MKQAMETPLGASVARAREAIPARSGWRAGRPVEDPEKTKRWGFVTAKPSEYLVHVRLGRVLPRSSGQGASCFKWPWDAVAIVPTSLQRLQFRADQITLEKVGVEVVGLAVFRIAEPLLAYRVLNFSFPERAQEKLIETLTGMFIGATRRLVANLTVDECLAKRKSALADELLREISPVVGGLGRPEDSTRQGWGVVIDTIEIQEVRILSERVFAALQAPYRTAIDRRAREAEQLAERELAEQRIDGELALKQRRFEAEQAEAVAAADAELRRVALKIKEAEAVLAAQEIEDRRRAYDDDVARARAAVDAELTRIRAEAERAAGESLLELDRKRAEVERIRADATARVRTVEKLPELAAAVGQRIQEVRIHQLGGSEQPLGLLVQGVRGLREVARAAWEDDG